VAFAWPAYLESAGSAAPGVITEKLESVRVEYTDWFRRFQVMAAYSIPGQPVQHRAICDVSEKTYDSIHVGNAVVVHYFGGLLNQPFIPATHFSLCSNFASSGLRSSVVRHLVIAFVALLAILFLWRVLRIRIAMWLLLPWLCLSFAYLGVPHVEPEPEHPVSATAIVDSVTTITTLGATSNDESIPLPHPYQIVLLKFVPPGMDTAVTVVDKIDVGSVPNLKEGQSADIIYDREHPRFARLQSGTRLFPGRTLKLVILCSIASIGLVAIAAGIGGFFRLIRRSIFR